MAGRMPVLHSGHPIHRERSLVLISVSGLVELRVVLRMRYETGNELATSLFVG
jgi:hypothetical protein